MKGWWLGRRKGEKESHRERQTSAAKQAPLSLVSSRFLVLLLNNHCCCVPVLLLTVA